MAADWDYNGKLILGHIDNDVCVWSAKSGRLLQRLVGHQERILSEQLSPDGRYALTSSWKQDGDYVPKEPFKDTSVRLWDLVCGRQLWQLTDESRGVFSADGRSVVSFFKIDGARFGASVRDVATAKPLSSFALPDFASPQYCSLSFSPDKCQVLLDAQWRAVLFDSKVGSEIGRHSFKYNRFMWRGGGFQFYAPRDLVGPFTPGALADAWDFKGNHPMENSGILESARFDPELKGLDVWSDTVDPARTRFAVQTPSCTALYDLRTGRRISRVRNAPWGRLIGFSTDGSTFLVGGAPFVVYDAKTGAPLRTLAPLGNRVRSSMWSNYG